MEKYTLDEKIMLEAAASIRQSRDDQIEFERLYPRFNDLQGKLKTHFNNLSKQREEVFALEHPLNAEELEFIKERLDPIWLPINQFWLLWIVGTTEAGYNFTANGKYWDKISDNELTASSRNKIRDCYKRFSKDYNGIKPVGIWADEYTIISWPITHSIIPSYLQTQLANEILQISTSLDLNKTHFSSPKALGEFIVENYSESGHQFDTIMKHPEILGALALEFEGSEVESPIHKVTFTRIIESFKKEVTNLDHISKETKNNFESARKRTRSFALGSTTSRGKNSLEGVSLNPFVYEERAEEWVIKIRLPRIKNEQYSRIRKDLLENPLRLNFAREWTLYAGDLAYRVPDKKFDIQGSDLNKPLIEYSNGDTPEQILDRYSIKSIFGEFPWIFKLNKDENRGEKISGRWLRDSTKYLYVSDVDVEDNELFKSIQLGSEVLKAYQITIPDNINEQIIEILKKNNLGINDGIVIEPLGNSMVDFHQENIHLQEGNPLILRLLSNVTITEISLTLSDDDDKEIDKLELKKLNHNEDYILDLDQRLPGVYHIHLAYSDEFQKDLSLNFELTITPRENWQADNDYHSLFAELKKSGRDLPLIPSLDQILDKQVEFFISKPSSSTVNIELELFEHDNSLEKLEIPVTEDHYETNDWEEQVLTKIQSFDVAKATNLKVIINGFEHGHYIFNCRKKGSTRFYWSYESKKLYLNDENEELDEPRVSFRPISDPLLKAGGKETSFDDKKDAYYLYPKESGLYIYEYGDKSANILFIKDYKDEVSVPNQNQSPDKLYRILKSWLDPDRVVCIHPNLTQENIHRNILQKLGSNLINTMLIKAPRWQSRENKYISLMSNDRDENILWSYIRDELRRFQKEPEKIRKFKEALNQGPIKKAIMGGAHPELRISSKLEGEELCAKDIEKIKELLESIKLDVEIDLNYGVYLDEKGRVILLGKKGFSKDEIEKVMTRLRAHLPDYEIKDHQEKWGSKDILDLSLGTITEELGKFGTDDYFKHFYNFSVNPFNEDIFNKAYELSKEEKSESDGNNINYRASGLKENPFSKHNVFEKNKRHKENQLRTASIIFRYVLFKASEGRERAVGKKDIFPGFTEI